MRSSILTDDMNHCYLCGKYVSAERGNRNIHEVFFGSANRKKSITWSCCVPLCIECHNRVHHDHDVDWKLKQECQKRFEELYGFIKFTEVFKRNYL